MKKTYLKYLLVGLLLVGILCTIVYLSGQSSDETSQLTEWYSTTFPYWIVYPEIFGYTVTLRDSAHIYEYLLLGLIVATLLVKQKHRFWRMGGAVLLCALISNLDQLSKPFLSGREYDAGDLIYDAIGYVTDILLVNLVHALYLKHKNSKEEKKMVLQERKMMHQALFDIVKASLWNTPCELPDSADLNVLHEEMHMQAIAALPDGWVKQSVSLPPALAEKWKKENMRQIMFFLRILYLQDALINLLETEGLHPVILKGCAAAVAYPQPELRAMGDVDILVPLEEFDRCLQIMTAHGYTIPVEEHFKGYHVNLRKDGIHFELHHRPAGVEDNQRGEYLMQVITQGFQSIAKREVSECTVPMLPPLQNGMVLLLHIEKHLKEGLGLRQIIDWMMFAHNHLDDDTWKNAYQTVFAKGGLEELAMTVTRMCQIYLGLSTEKITWCAKADRKLCDSLMEYIMEQGNFGVKERKTGHGANVLSRNGIGMDFIKNLQRNGERNWKVLEKYPNLRCFAWTYQICHYVYSAFFRENAITRTWQDFKTSTKRKHLLKKLGMYQTRVNRRQ